MNKKSIKKNYLYNLLYQIITILLPIITTPYISRVLGVEKIGIYSYAISISAYFILFGSLGIALYGQREIAFCQNDKNKYSKAFWEIFFLRVITMSISLIIFYFTFGLHSEYSLYYKILTLELIGNCIDISWFFQGLEEFKKTVIRNIIVKLISVLCIFLFIKTQNDLYKYFIIYVLSILLGNLSLWFYLPQYVAKVKLKKLKIRKHLKPTLSLFIPQIAIQIYTMLDKTMIGALISDKSEVGFYAQGEKIIKLLLTIITSLGTVMMPRIAFTYSQGEYDKIKEYMNKSFRLVFLLAFPLIFGICVIAENFVPIFFGAGYDRVVIIMQLLSSIILLIGLSNVIGTQYLLPTKRQKEYTISVVVGSLVNLVFNSILIPKFGAVGATIGTIIAEFIVTTIQIYFTRKNFEFKKILKLSKNYIVSAICMFIICLLLKKVIKNNLFSLIAQVIVGMISYGIILILIKDKFVKEIINKILKRS